mgnify:CR=1 FL=1
MDATGLSPADLRKHIRRGSYDGLTTGLAAGYLQGNVVILPAEAAGEFEAFCRANPQSLPLIERGKPGDPMLACGTDFDVRSDLPRYRVWHDGVPTETLTDISPIWAKDSVAFILGRWFANEAALADAGIRLRHMELGIQGALFRTSIAAVPAGRFAGPVVASMRPFAQEDVARVAAITGKRPLAHGAPLHIGSPDALGIDDLNTPDFGDPLPPLPGETAMFWACGLTGQEALASSGLPFFITHEHGHMAVTDIPVE